VKVVTGSASDDTGDLAAAGAGSAGLEIGLIGGKITSLAAVSAGGVSV